MNDCVFCYIGCCKECNKCYKYISANSEKGSEIVISYSDEIAPLIEETLKPIRDKIRKEYNLEDLKIEK